MDTFLYHLGHSKQLCFLEFQYQGGSVISTFKNLVKSNTNLSLEKLAGVVVKTKILSEVSKQLTDKSFYEKLESVFEEFVRQGKVKKIGISLPKNMNQKQVLSLAKTAGLKKVYVIDKMPNEGQLNGWKSWIIVSQFQDSFIVQELVQSSSQKFWSELDVSLNNDMRRGIMNLKLGKMLMNLSSNQVIWDPFCGQGRIFVADLDSDRLFFASDIDEQSVEATKANIKIAQNYYEKANRAINATLKDCFVFNVNEFGNGNLEEITQHNFSIITEGYLGHNFNRRPTAQEARKEYDKVWKIWSGFLTRLAKTQVREVIFCMPYYNLGFDYKTQSSFVQKLGFKQEISFQDTVVYSRVDSNVGHQIIYLSKN